MVPFNAVRALNEFEAVLTSLYWYVNLWEEDSIGDAALLWDSAGSFAARLRNRFLGGRLDRLDIDTGTAQALENLYRSFCTIQDAYRLSAPDFPRAFKSRKRKPPMSCLELVKFRRGLGVTGQRLGLGRIVAENDTFTDDPRAADLGYALILSDLFPFEVFQDGIWLSEWNLRGKRCQYKPTTAEQLRKTGSDFYGVTGDGWPVAWTYAVCQACGHVIGTDLIDAEELGRVYRKCDQGGQESDSGQKIVLPRPVYSRPYSPAELVKKFNRSWKVIKGWIDSGQLRAIPLSSKNYRIHLEDDPDNV